MADASGVPLRGATVGIVGNMSHAGMVPVLAEAGEVSDGRYVTGDFQFTMAGDWILTVQATLPGGKQVERNFNLRTAADNQFGPQLAPRNLAGVIPWVQWRGLIVLALLLAGNLFCMACPFMLTRQLAKRLFPASRALAEKAAVEVTVGGVAPPLLLVLR